MYSVDNNYPINISFIFLITTIDFIFESGIPFIYCTFCCEIGQRKNERRSSLPASGFAVELQ